MAQFQPGRLLQPIAPGLSGALNPLMFIGSGMARGDIGGSLGQMAGIQQAQQQLQMQQARNRQISAMEMARFEAERQAVEESRTQEAANRVVMENYFRGIGGASPLEQMMLDILGPEATAQAITKPTDPTAAMRLYSEMGAETGTGKPFDQWYAEDFKPGGGVTIQMGEKLPANYRWRDPADPAAGVEPIPGGPAERPTERQQDIAAYVQNAEAASNILRDITDYNPAGVMMAANPMTRLIASENDKRRYDAQLAWTWAVLRAESGGTVTQEEAANQVNIFFEHPGDSEMQKADKARLRAEKERTMRERSGPALGEPSEQDVTQTGWEIVR